MKSFSLTVNFPLPTFGGGDFRDFQITYMNTVAIILVSVLPSMIVAVAAFFIVKYFIENDQKKKVLELKFQSKSITTPVRLQAYERMALFLERIEPNQLLFRVNNPELTAAQMQAVLLSTIRSEYEHNMSQQIYISPEVWESIKRAKENVVNAINIAAGKLSPEAMAIDLDSAIFQITAAESPVAAAMNSLKKEIQTLY